MTSIAKRFVNNPLFRPSDIRPTAPGMEVKCVFNPGAFVYQGRIGLVLRVAEAPVERPGQIATVSCSPATGNYQPRFFSLDAPGLICKDKRGFSYRNYLYSTTISSFLVAWSDHRGRNFVPDYSRRIMPSGEFETYGIEDCRVGLIEGVYHLTYSVTSEKAIAVGHMTTRDWITFSDREIIFPPPNKDCCLFPRRIGDSYYGMHRPSAGDWGGNSIWMASSPDLKHWGNHRQLLTPRTGFWDSERIGPNASPIETPDGWLLIYHGADNRGVYCLGAVLLDLEKPWNVIARCIGPIMSPELPYETSGGFYDNVVFSNGHVTAGEEIIIYYGAADMVTAGATLQIGDIMRMLRHS